jgi:hypothetical protein
MLTRSHGNFETLRGSLKYEGFPPRATIATSAVHPVLPSAMSGSRSGVSTRANGNLPALTHW